MTETSDDLYELILNIRGAFNELRAYADDNLSDLGITAAMRAEMEFIYQNGPSAVPEIAKAKSVSRQHMQKLADALIAMGMVMMIKNPLHKRSALVALTPKGRQAFKTIMAREAVQLTRLTSQMDTTQIKAANLALKSLRKLLPQ